MASGFRWESLKTLGQTIVQGGERVGRCLPRTKSTRSCWHDRGTVRTRAAPGPPASPLPPHNYWLLNRGPSREIDGRFKSCAFGKFPGIERQIKDQGGGRSINPLRTGRDLTSRAIFKTFFFFFVFLHEISRFFSVFQSSLCFSVGSRIIVTTKDEKRLK